MTSEERKEARYQRRKAKRMEKARAAAGKSYDEVMSFTNLCAAGKKCCDGSRWKSSTINFEANLLSECFKEYTSLRAGIRRFSGFHSFTTIEHGKARDIDALPIRERAAQKCITANLLTESYSRSFIYDNSASLPGKGMDFALNRLKKHLRRHYRLHGTKGGILQFDFKGYFASLQHEVIKQRARLRIWDDKLYALFCSYVDDFMLRKTATKEHKGVGLGSEVSQIIALDYASPIDHFIKDVLGIEGSARYMDDGYIISESIETLKAIRTKLFELAEKIGIRLNDKKTIITPFRHHSFRFLKMRIKLTDTGAVVLRLSRQSIRAIRRKLHIFREWVSKGKMLFEEAAQSYQSWRAHAKRCRSYKTLVAMDKTFSAMFKDELAARRKKFPCTLRAVKTRRGWTYTENTHRKDKAA